MYWTSDDALSITAQPESLLILGGGAVGCELAQAFALLGTRVHLVEISDRLLAVEADWVSPMLANQLREDGVDVRVGVKPERVDPSGSGVRVRLENGETLEAERLLVAGGRNRRAAGLGLDTDAGLLVGASCVGPAGDARGAELALAIRAKVPLDTLQHHIRAFSTWSEAITALLPDE